MESQECRYLTGNKKNRFSRKRKSIFFASIDFVICIRVIIIAAHSLSSINTINVLEIPYRKYITCSTVYQAVFLSLMKNMLSPNSTCDKQKNRSVSIENICTYAQFVDNLCISRWNSIYSRSLIHRYCAQKLFYLWTVWISLLID